MPLRFAKVDDMLFRGGEPELLEIPILRNYWGIRWIVSLDERAGKYIDRACRILGIRHTILPLTDGNDPKVEELIPMVSEWKKEGPVYVHCKHGKDRTGMACALYRVLIDDWDVNDALAEAASFGMGYQVGPEHRKTFFKAVRRLVDKYEETADVNHNIDSPDIVSEHRSTLEEVQPIPAPATFNPLSSPFGGTGDTGAFPGQQSFAPYLDNSGNDYLNRPASIRIFELLKLSQANQKVYKYCKVSDVEKFKTFWASSPEAALVQAKQNNPGFDQHGAQVFSVNISSRAKVKDFPQEPTKPLVQAGLLSGADVLRFQMGDGTSQYMIVDPAVLEDILAMRPQTGDDSNNDNDVPMVGEHDNYDGMANFVFPGSGTGMVPGLSGGSGGFGGFVQVPTQQF